MDPMLILDDKSKEKALAEKMKKKYGTTRGTRGIIVKRINNASTQLGANILGCKLLRKCCKEEVPAGVITVATQCTEGTSMSWAPYLLNLFQKDCKDA
jgi:DNA phosphorothioation-dependent restriction protein DptG